MNANRKSYICETQVPQIHVTENKANYERNERRERVEEEATNRRSVCTPQGSFGVDEVGHQRVTRNQLLGPRFLSHRI